MSLTCSASHLWLVGFSEMLQLAGVINASNVCVPIQQVNRSKWWRRELHHTSELEDRFKACGSKWPRARMQRTFPNASAHLRDSLCREELYSQKPFVRHCAPRHRVTFQLQFEWKSFMYSARDELHLQRVLQAADDAGTTRRALVLLSGGPHHFSRFGAHRRSMYHTFDLDAGSWPWPQAWLDDYMRDADRLFGRFAAARPRRVCVVWKASNIARRAQAPAGSRHHPSISDGPHHLLNRVSIALARRHGLSVVDLSDLTLAAKPSGRDQFGAPEGDAYHGYDSEALADALLRRACAACEEAGWG